MAYLYLFTAIALEVAAAIATRYTEGFTAPLPTAVTVIFAVSSYFIFSLSLKHGMTIAVGYAIWSGVGVTSVAIVGAVLFGDLLTTIQLGGIVLIIGGLAAVQLAGNVKDA